MSNITFCRCERCNRVLRSREAIEVGYGSLCCRKATGKTLKQVLKERQKEADEEDGHVAQIEQ